MKNHELITFASADELAQAGASDWLHAIAAANDASASYCVALSGGRISLKFFNAFVDQASARRISTRLVHFFWADERCVPPDDAESNFRTAHELLFTPLRIDDAQIHRIRGEDSPEIAAQKALMEISRIAPKNPGGLPVLDLIFLGMGEDGHVASLFPGKTEGTLPAEIFCPVKHSPKPPPDRVTLSYSTIAAAKNVWVLASGAGKKPALLDSLSPKGCTPLARVIQSRQNTKIFCDFQTG